MKVGIIGGGMMGVCLGYFLSQKGVEVEIFESSSRLGGLAGSITLEDGTAVDRFYHTILSSDNSLSQLCTELGIASQLRFKETRMGFFYKGEIHSMNNIVEFLRFPPLGWIDRFRLGLTVLYAQIIKDWRNLESISVEEWLIRIGGRQTYQNIWRPLLKAKFDGGFENTPATYIWSRLVRMKSTRSGANQKEEAGHLIGSYSMLIRAMVERIQAAGGKIHLNSPVKQIVIDQNVATGVLVDGEILPFNLLVSTLPLPILREMIPGTTDEYRNFLAQTSYLGIICPLLVLDRPLSGYWTLNITDDSIPFTGIIETTSYIDPEYVGGHHLVYLPKYTSPDSPLLQMSDEEIKGLWLRHLQSMFPGFNPDWIRYFLVNRERYVEPLHGLNQTHNIPSRTTPIINFYSATSAQIYPSLTNGESIVRFARETTNIIVNKG
jgi:protoporphyrinogen oxidase